MTTLRDELAEKTKAKIIELFGPESALAQAMEDNDFLEKLAQLVAWIYGEIMLSQPRLEPQRDRPRTTAIPAGKWTGKPWVQHKWDSKWATSAATFAYKLRSAMSKYE